MNPSPNRLLRIFCGRSFTSAAKAAVDSADVAARLEAAPFQSRVELFQNEKAAPFQNEGGTDDRPQTRLFEAFSRELLKAGVSVRFEARGASMSPAIRDGEVVHVEPADVGGLRAGDIVLVKNDRGFRLHRLVLADAGTDVYVTRGDCGQQDDAPVKGKEILGIAVAKEVRIGERMVRARLKGMRGRLALGLARGQRVAEKLLGRLVPHGQRGENCTGLRK